MQYEWAVIEYYPDGGTWTHYFKTEQAALDAAEDLKEAHAGRIYEVTGSKK